MWKWSTTVANSMHAVSGSVPASELAKAVRHVRANPSHPGLFLREFCIEPLGLSVHQAARTLEVAPRELRLILACHAPVSAELALKLEPAGWSTSRMWLALQADYDRARQRREHVA